MAFTENPSLSNNPKILNNSLNFDFTVIFLPPAFSSPDHPLAGVPVSIWILNLFKLTQFTLTFIFGWLFQLFYSFSHYFNNFTFTFKFGSIFQPLSLSRTSYSPWVQRSSTTWTTSSSTPPSVRVTQKLRKFCTQVRGLRLVDVLIFFIISTLFFPF